MQSFPEVKMGMVRIASVVSLLIAGQAMAASVVNLTAGLQSGAVGSAYEAYVAGYPSVYFPAASELDNQHFYETDKVTWSVAVTASGIQAAGNGAGFEIKGVANVVCNVELRQGTVGGPLVASAVYSSDVNDGTPMLASAAFAKSMKVGTFGPGALPDNILTGGPLMSTWTMPTNPNDGTLLGMGAGYSSWTRSAGTSALTKEGVGWGTPPTNFGKSTICEGQLSGLTPGTYVLKIVPAPGINVLRGDISLTVDQPAFAVAADQTNGDTITFVIDPGQVVPTLVTAASSRIHGSTTYDVPVTKNGAAAIDPRQNGTVGVMTLVYDNPPANPTCGGVTIVNGTCSNTVVTGNTLKILMNYSANACVEVTAPDGAGTATMKVLTHTGNVNLDDNVNVLDMQAVKLQLFQPVDNTNKLNDINLDNLINVLDMQAVKLNLFAPLPTCN